MSGGELIEGCPVNELVQRGDHGCAFARWMIGWAVERVGQKRLRLLRLSDQRIQLHDLLTNNLAPSRAGSVEDGGRGLQRQAQPVGDLDERQPA